MRLNALIVAVVAGVAYAADPAPVSFDPGNWLGIDGNWSTVKFLLGSTSELVHVLVSTSLSEFWAVGPGGCLEKEPHCIAARGGIYTPSASKHWWSMGTWQLGLEYLGYGGNGQYGLDSVNAYSSITDIGFGMSNVLMAAINTTDYYMGLFGLGITQGNFGNMVAKSPLTQAVQAFGWIPSYSYGYTAGASYRNIPVSITLGGIDLARFIPHGVGFTLAQQDNMPRALVRGIEVAVGDDGIQPDDWDSTTNVLSSWNNSFTALIDSTTPYLWLPEEVCDAFAQAFNLTYNSTFDLYTITNDQYNAFESTDSFAFTWSLTSLDNHDNFGQPLNVPGIVNITVPITAFVGLLQYPFMNQAIRYGDPAVPYFSLRKAQNSSSIIIGRSFLQESYLITKYDEAMFSIHQAQFPERPAADARLVPIKQPKNSPYPPPPAPSTGNQLSTGQMVGVTVGVISLCLACMVSVCCYCRRRKARRDKAEAVFDESKDCASTLGPDSPQTPVSRLFSRIAGRKRAQTASAASDEGGPHASEAPDSEIYELPAPMAPAELDAGDGGDDGSILGETVSGTDATQNMSVYEIARRKIERQLQGPVPEYSPPSDGMVPPEEKMTPYDSSTTRCDAPREEPIPILMLKSGQGTNSLPGALPSPLSPRAEYNSHPGEIPSPSPITASAPPSSYHTSSTWDNTQEMTRTNQSNSANHSVEMTAPETSNLPVPPSTALQKSPIDPTNIVCLGPLPQNLQSLRQSTMLAQVTGQESRRSFTPRFNAESYPSEQSLGSNYTDEEERVMQEMTRQATLSMTRGHVVRGAVLGAVRQGNGTTPVQTREIEVTRYQANRVTEPDTAGSGERIDGRDLVHIPQMAEKRYSWEEGE